MVEVDESARGGEPDAPRGVGDEAADDGVGGQGGDGDAVEGDGEVAWAARFGGRARLRARTDLCARADLRSRTRLHARDWLRACDRLRACDDGVRAEAAADARRPEEALVIEEQDVDLVGNQALGRAVGLEEAAGGVETGDAGGVSADVEVAAGALGDAVDAVSGEAVAAGPGADEFASGVEEGEACAGADPDLAGGIGVDGPDAVVEQAVVLVPGEPLALAEASDQRGAVDAHPERVVAIDEDGADRVGGQAMLAVEQREVEGLGFGRVGSLLRLVYLLFCRVGLLFCRVGGGPGQLQGDEAGDARDEDVAAGVGEEVGVGGVGDAEGAVDGDLVIVRKLEEAGRAAHPEILLGVLDQGAPAVEGQVEGGGQQLGVASVELPEAIVHGEVDLLADDREVADGPGGEGLEVITGAGLGDVRGSAQEIAGAGDVDAALGVEGDVCEAARLTGLDRDEAVTGEVFRRLPG